MEILTHLLDALRSLLDTRLFQINQTPVTVTSIAMFAVVITAFAVVSKVLRRILLERTLKRFKVDEGTAYNLMRLAHYLIMLIGALVAFQFVGIDLSGLAVVFGLLSVGVGFGLQGMTANLVAGLILLFERPIRVGDRVTVGGTEGDVIDISMRATTIVSLQNISIIVPNSEFIAKEVVNWSHRDPKVMIDVDVGVSYGSDLDVVLRSLREVAEENGEVLKQPPPEVLHTGFGDSSWNMRLRVWIANPKRHHYVQSDLNCAIVRKFRANNVEIPFPQRDLHLRSPLPIPLDREASGNA